MFQQQRDESLFDTGIDRVHEIVYTLLTQKGVFHTKIHYSYSQLTCWFSRGPFVYEKFVREEVLADGFVARSPDTNHAGRTSPLGSLEIKINPWCWLREYRRVNPDQKIF